MGFLTDCNVFVIFSTNVRNVPCRVKGVCAILMVVTGITNCSSLGKCLAGGAIMLYL